MSELLVLVLAYELISLIVARKLLGSMDSWDFRSIFIRNPDDEDRAAKSKSFKLKAILWAHAWPRTLIIASRTLLFDSWLDALATVIANRVRKWATVKPPFPKNPNAPNIDVPPGFDAMCEKWEQEHPDYFKAQEEEQEKRREEAFKRDKDKYR